MNNTYCCFSVSGINIGEEDNRCDVRGNNSAGFGIVGFGCGSGGCSSKFGGKFDTENFFKIITACDAGYSAGIFTRD